VFDGSLAPSGADLNGDGATTAADLVVIARAAAASLQNSVEVP